MFGLRKKIFGKPLEKLDKALSVAQTQEEKNEAFENAFKEGESEYMKVAKPTAIVIGSVLGGVAIAGVVGAGALAGAGSSVTGATGAGVAAAGAGVSRIPDAVKTAVSGAGGVKDYFNPDHETKEPEAINNDQIMTYGLIGIGIIILISLIRK